MWLIALKAITANAAVMVAAFGFGSWVQRLLPSSFSRLTRVLLATIAGMGLLGLTVFIVGHISLTRWTVGAILIAGIALALRSGSAALEARLPLSLLPAAVVGIALTLTAIGGLSEPIGDWGKDGVAYHLLGPKVWLRNGVIRPIPDNMNSSYPCLGEMVFTATRAFGGDRAPYVSATWTLALFLGVAASLGRRIGLNWPGAWWVAALLVTMPAVYNGGHSGFVDVIYATFILAAARVGLDAVELRHFAIFGFFGGLALATKYPAMLALPILIFCAMWRRKNQGTGNGRTLRKAFTAAGVACLVASPIYLNNWILLGSPLYPPPASVAEFLRVKYFPTEAIRAFYRYNIVRGNGHGRGLIHFFTLPFNLTYHTADFSGAGGIGLAPLAFGPLGLLAAWREAFARRLALTGFLLTAIWFITMQESRYLIHVYTLSAIFAVAGWQKAVSLTHARGKLLCGAVVAISVAYGAYMDGTVTAVAAECTLSSTCPEYRHRYGVVFVEAFDYINHDPAVTKVLILDRSVPAYYSDKDYVKPFGQWGELVYPDIKTTADVLPRLRELGVTHVMDVESTIAPYQVPAGYPALKLVFEVPGQRVYQVQAP